MAGGLLSGNAAAAGNGFISATVNAALAAVDAPLLTSVAPDLADMIADVARVNPDGELTKCQ